MTSQMSGGKRLCLKLLPQFESHLNETYISWSLPRVDVDAIFLWGPSKRLLELCPFFWISHITMVRKFVYQKSSNIFFQVNLIKPYNP